MPHKGGKNVIRTSLHQRAPEILPGFGDGRRAARQTDPFDKCRKMPAFSPKSDPYKAAHASAQLERPVRGMRTSCSSGMRSPHRKRCLKSVAFRPFRNSPSERHWRRGGSPGFAKAAARQRAGFYSANKPIIRGMRQNCKRGAELKERIAEITEKLRCTKRKP